MNIDFSHNNTVVKIKIYFIILLSVLFLFIINPRLHSQTKREIDSLKTELTKSDIDTNKIKILNELSKKTNSLDLNESYKYASEALILSKKLGFDKGKLKAYSNIGYCYSQMKKYDSALLYLDSALMYAEKLNAPKQKVVVYNYYYLLYERTESYTKAAEYAFKALSIAESINFDAGKAALYINIGSMYLTQENYAKSKEYLMKALKIAKKIKHKKKIAIVNMNIGTIYINKKKYDSALYYYFKALDTYKNLEVYPKTISIYNSIADIYFLKNELGKAYEYYRKALALAEKFQDKAILIWTFNALANYYLKVNKIDSAFYYADSSYRMSKHKKNISDRGTAAKILFRIYYKKKEYKKACDYLNVYRIETEKQIEKEKKNRLNNIEAQYIFEKHEKRIQMIQMEKRMLKIVGILLISMILLITIIIIQKINKKRINDIKDKEIIALKLSKTKAELKQKKAELKSLSFTIIEKNKRIEKLQDQISLVRNSHNEEELNQKKEELKNLKILTEDDWIKFKSIFKEVYFEFTSKIDYLNPNLSEGDKRQLMLIKLGFSISQSAEILGVGYKSIQKARQRLAKKLNLKSSKEIFELIDDTE